MPTKTPTKGKKSATKEGAPKKSVSAKPRESEPDEDEADAPPTPVKKPAVKARGAVPEIEPPPVVPARRLTPEAKAQVNAMVQRGIPLAEALKTAASWETFVAPVKEEPAKLVQGKAGPSPDGAPRPPRRAEESDGDEADRDEEEEPVVDSED